MMRKHLQFLFACLLITSATTAQTYYEVSFPNPNSHAIQVDVRFSNLPTDSVDVAIPVWTPGSYMVREFSKNVEGFKAFGAAGDPLVVKKIRKNAWRVYHAQNGSISCNYQVYAFEQGIRAATVDADMAFINGAAVFMYIRELKDREHMVIYRPAPGWNRISTTLPVYNNDLWARTATNYDQLIDCPVVLGSHTEFAFDYQGINHRVAMVGEAKYDSLKIKNDFLKIIDAETRLFGDNPNKEYLFIILNMATGGGGLEHTNGCVLQVDRKAYESEGSYNSFLSLTAHEYFHLWLGKRIRPVELGPFNYDRENYTRQLWFIEGFTSYYDDYMMYLAGFYTQAQYLDIAVGNYQALLNTPGTDFQSVSDASFDAWIKYYQQNENSKNTTVSYYTKGAVLAVMFNLDVIHHTDGIQSLNTLMHHLYNEHYKNFENGLSDRELFDLFQGLFGKPYKTFFDQYIDGTFRVPFEEYMELAGIRVIRKDGMRARPGYLGASLQPGTRGLEVKFVERNGPAMNQGLSYGDVIQTLDGKGPDAIPAYLATLKPGATVKILVLRGGLPKEISVTLGESTQVELGWEFVEKPTDKQIAVRNVWLPLP